jgi:hypothetical protein
MLLFAYLMTRHPDWDKAEIRVLTAGTAWWDFTDQNAWQRAPAGLLRDDMTPKPAYDELHRLIKGKWWTRTTTKVEAGSRARFRGFFGQYEVTALVGGHRLAGTFRLDKSTQETKEVQLKA